MHPLALLQPDEITAAVEILRASGHLGDATTVRRLAVHEPSKTDLAAGTARRRLDAWLYDHGTRRINEAVVDLEAASVSLARVVDGAVPMVGFVELREAMDGCRADDGVRAALAARGVDDPEKVQVDPWPTGNFGIPHESGRRISRCIFFYREKPTDNGYARPIDGLLAYYDHDERRVVHLDDLGTWPVPTEVSNYDLDSVGGPRTDLTPIEITQPEGTSFTVTDTNRIRWQNWELRVLMDHTEGLVLHSVTYHDQGRARPVLHRASLAEMVVPYGEQRPTQSFKNALDIGELGLGRLVNSLTLGCDCLGEITYLDTCWALEDGTPVPVSQGICLHEEDFGILWKHHDSHAETTEVRRSRRFVISSIHTVGNYEYGLFWYLYLDGTIELQVKLTGIVTTMTYAEGDDLTWASLVAPEVASPIHQHLFCARLDLAVDGEANTVYRVDVEADEPGPDNPLDNGFRAVSTRLETEQQAIDDIDPARSRTWRIVNESARNRLGHPTAYKLLPAAAPTMYAAPTSSISGRAGFARHNVWVTPTSPDERFPAGSNVTQSSPDGQGLPAWTDADRAIVDTDVTLWHTFGVTHVPRPEDYPVMPVEYAGFLLVPFGFFDRNPALDVPPGDHCH